MHEKYAEEEARDSNSNAIMKERSAHEKKLHKKL